VVVCSDEKPLVFLVKSRPGHVWSRACMFMRLVLCLFAAVLS